MRVALYFYWTELSDWKVVLRGYWKEWEELAIGRKKTTQI